MMFSLINLMNVPPALYDEWADWNTEHARHMVEAGFISGQTLRVRPDYSRNHPEALPTRPAYSMVNFYEVGQDMLDALLVTKAPETGQGPTGGTRPFPSPLGPNMGDGFLLEPLYDKITGPASPAQEAVCRLAVMMMVPDDLFDEWADWNREHARDMVKAGFHSGQTFRVRTDFSYIHPETLSARPPYNMVQLYEVGADMVDGMLTREKPVTGEGPAGGTRPFPSPLGRHMGDGYLLEPISEKFQRKPS